MRSIHVMEATLRHAPGDLSFRERLELARLLIDMRPDAISAGFIRNEKADGVFLRTIAPEMAGVTLCVDCELDAGAIMAACAQLVTADKKRLCLHAPASAVRMEYIGHKKAPQVLADIAAAAQCAQSLCAQVSLVLEDATRADRGFISDAIGAAYEQGVRSVVLCDDAGALLPGETADFVRDIKGCLPGDVYLYMQCADEMRIAAACAFEALRGGADGVVTACRGLGLAETGRVSRILSLRGEAFGLRCGLNTTRLNRAAGRIGDILAPRRADASPFDSLGSAWKAAQEDISLDAGSDITSVAAAICAHGYELSQEDIAKVYEAFRRVQSKKPVGARELDALIASAAMQAPPVYRLKSYHVNASNIISPSAHVVLEKDGKELQGLSVGNGPIDAAFLAIEQIAGRHFELDDFQIQAVTEGRGAMGDALVKLRHNGRLYSGKGLSNDIIGASIRAYLNALNNIVHEEGGQ